MDSESKVLRSFAVTMYSLLRVLGHGRPLKMDRDLKDFMTAEPSPGDLVMECTTIDQPEHDRRRFGVFVRSAWEILPVTPEDERQHSFNPHARRPAGRVSYIEGVGSESGQVHRWPDARFLRVPRDIVPW